VRVSVCMGVYNGEKYIAEQVASILPQLGADDEIIVSDDLSVDGTLQRIEAFQDSRIKIVKNPHPAGLILNFENALKHASGDVIFLADQDDIWLPSKVDTMKRLLKSYDLVVSDCDVIDADGNVLYDSFFRLKRVKKGVLQNIIKNYYVGCCMAFRREILNVALPFPKNIYMHDVWIAVLAELVGETHFCEQRLMRHRRHDSNASTTASKSPNSLMTKIKLRLDLASSLFRRYMQYRFAQ
jgi:glycosyltransferase involved in cell wall biosynthesis